MPIFRCDVCQEIIETDNRQATNKSLCNGCIECQDIWFSSPVVGRHTTKKVKKRNKEPNLVSMDALYQIIKLLVEDELIEFEYENCGKLNVSNIPFLAPDIAWLTR